MSNPALMGETVVFMVETAAHGDSLIETMFVVLCMSPFNSRETYV
jgi:hypothetical protein